MENASPLRQERKSEALPDHHKMGRRPSVGHPGPFPTPLTFVRMEVTSGEREFQDITRKVLPSIASENI